MPPYLQNICRYLGPMSIFLGEMGFADIIQVKDLVYADYHKLFQWPQCSHKGQALKLKQCSTRERGKM